MTPAAHELPYYRASRGAHRAWCDTQPQYVIPGVLDETDAGTAPPWVASVSSSPPQPANRAPRAISPALDAGSTPTTGGA